MRLQHNPLREKPAPSFIRDIVFVVVTHLPIDNGYHADRFEVVKTCLETMRNNAHRTHTFYVFDNGSNEEFRNWLYNEFKPDMLTLSKNIGKSAARTTAITSLPLGTIVCYSDDDILYYDNWLNPQIELLNLFPNVAAVSCSPIRTMFRWGNKNTLNWAMKNATVEQGRFIPDEYELDYCDGIGRTWDEHLKLTDKDIDYKITYKDKSAYAHAHHCQFVGYAAKVDRVMNYDNQAMGPEKNFDIEMDKTGLRLCTIERHCKHIGNIIDDKLRSEINEMMAVKA